MVKDLKLIDATPLIPGKRAWIWGNKELGKFKQLLKT